MLQQDYKTPARLQDLAIPQPCRIEWFVSIL
jgi:hypothetical protein